MEDEKQLDLFLSRVEDLLKKLSKRSYAYKLLNEAAVSAILATKRKSSRNGNDESSIDRLVARYTIKVPASSSSAMNNNLGSFEEILEKAKPAHFPDNFLQLLDVEQAPASNSGSTLQWRVKDGKTITIKNTEYKEKQVLPQQYSFDLETLARSIHGASIKGQAIQAAVANLKTLLQGKVVNFTTQALKQTAVSAIQTTALSKAGELFLERYLQQHVPALATVVKSQLDSSNVEYVFDGIGVVQEAIRYGPVEGLKEAGRRTLEHVADYGAEKLAEAVKQREDVPKSLHIPVTYAIKLAHKPLTKLVSKSLFGQSPQHFTLIAALESISDSSTRDEYLKLLKEAFEALSQGSSKL